MKFAKLSSAKMIALLIPQTLVPPTFRRLRYAIKVDHFKGFSNWSNVD